MSHRKPSPHPPYRLALAMVVGLVVTLAVQLVVQAPKALAAVQNVNVGER